MDFSNNCSDESKGLFIKQGVYQVRVPGVHEGIGPKTIISNLLQERLAGTKLIKP